MIPIYKPYLNKKILKYARDALDSTWISSQGKYIELCTERLQKILNVKHVLLTNTGTAACHLVAKCLHQAYSECQTVNMSDNVFVAAWNAFLYDKDFSIIILPTDEETWNIDKSKLDYALSLNKYALIVHNLGNIVNVPALQRKYPSAVFVEDNCEGFGGEYEGRPSGTSSLCSSFSFFGNKSVTSGEGGAFVTNDTYLYTYAKKLHGQGMSMERYIHDNLGYNYRMTNIEAAILYGQLGVMNEILDKKNEIFKRYTDAFSEEPFYLQQEEEGTRRANWIFGVGWEGSRGYPYVKNILDNKGIETRPMFYPASKHPYLRRNIRVAWNSSDVPEKLNKEVIMLPSYPELTIEEQNYIIESVREVCLTK
jgi:perosamine synthetase